MMKCGLLGKTLGHSFSPRIHAMLADYSYRLFEKREDEISEFMKNGDWDAINVTIPYKKTVIPYLSEMSDRAKKIGSVNTLIRKNGKILGDNTDYYGFEYLLKKSKIEIAGKKALIIGAGGASATAWAVLSDKGAKNVTVVSHENNTHDFLTQHSDAQVIVNTTPVGMYPKNGISPVDLSLFPRLCGVIDMIYNPSVTELIFDAKERDIPCISGLPMLVAQAKEACELFTGEKIDDSEIDRITQVLEKETKNIVLIGMPGCGKSSIGREIAKTLNREFIDCDAEIERAAKMSIPEIFSKYGEDRFRETESEVCAETGKKSGAVIATGGGVVTRRKNYRYLKQNSTVVLIKRDLSLLPSEGRPISQARDLREIEAERRELYAAFADITFEAHGVKETAKEIIEKIL